MLLDDDDVVVVSVDGGPTFLLLLDGDVENAAAEWAEDIIDGGRRQEEEEEEDDEAPLQAVAVINEEQERFIMDGPAKRTAAYPNMVGLVGSVACCSLDRVGLMFGGKGTKWRGSSSPKDFDSSSHFPSSQHRFALSRPTKISREHR